MDFKKLLGKMTLNFVASQTWNFSCKGMLFSPDLQAAQVIFLPTLVFMEQELKPVVKAHFVKDFPKFSTCACHVLKLDSTTGIITGAKICAGLHSFVSPHEATGWRKQILRW